MEDYVTYEQAKVLKKIGFDWVVTHFYDLEEPQERGIKGRVPQDFNVMALVSLASAPTLSQAQKWVYEKFGLWIEIIYEVKKESFEYNIFNKKDNTKKSFFNPWVKIIYDTPTKALSAGIDKVLELLKEQGNG